MSGAWYRFRAEIRHGGWKFIVMAALLLGIGGGVVLSAAAGARRTDTAFDRLDAATIAADVLVNPDEVETLSVLSDDVLRDIGFVEEWARVAGILTLRPDGAPMEVAFLAATDDRYGRTIERPVVREGRLPDPTRSDELFADTLGAESEGLRVGDRVTYLVLTEADLAGGALFELELPEIARRATAGEIGTPHEFTLVGIGVRTSDVVPQGSNASLFTTPAFVAEVGPFVFYGELAARLEGRSDAVDAFMTEVRGFQETAGVGIDFQTTAGDRATVARAIRPQVVALQLFAAVLAVGVLAAVAQAFSRRAKIGLGREPVLAGLGMTNQERRRLHLMRIASTTIFAPVVMVVVALSLSGVFPTGLARTIEPERGIRFDGWIVVPGALAITALAAATSAAAVATARRRTTRGAAPSRRVVQMMTSGLPPTVTTGVRLAFESGTMRSVPAKSTIVSAAIGTTVIVGALTFASSLDRFVSDPVSYGWDFDALVRTGDVGVEQEQYLLLDTGDLLSTMPSVSAWAPLYLQQATVDGRSLPAMGVGAGSGEQIHPTLVRGRIPADFDEVALGAVTLRDAGLDVGDTIGAGVDGYPFTIVGVVVLPGIANYAGSDQAALGVGALFSTEGFMIATSLGFQGGVNEEGELIPNGLLVDVIESGPESLAVLSDELDRALGEDMVVVDGPIQPSDVAGYARVRTTPLAVAAILGLLAAMTVGHGLIVSVRQRRRDFAVFRALGFTTRQVSQTVGWQASTVAVLAVVVGIPLGFVVGRVAWGTVTDRLGIVNVVVPPLLALVLTLPLALVLSNAAAAIPARVGVRMRPGQELRAE